MPVGSLARPPTRCESAKRFGADRGRTISVCPARVIPHIHQEQQPLGLLRASSWTPYIRVAPLSQPNCDSASVCACHSRTQGREFPVSEAAQYTLDIQRCGFRFFTRRWLGPFWFLCRAVLPVPSRPVPSRPSVPVKRDRSVRVSAAIARVLIFSASAPNGYRVTSLPCAVGPLVRGFTAERSEGRYNCRRNRHKHLRARWVL